MAEKRYYGTDVPRSTGPHPDPLNGIYQLITARQRFADIAKNCAKNSDKASMSRAEAIGYERACSDIEMLILESEPLSSERT